LFGLFISVNVFAQDTDTSKHDTLSHLMIVDARPINKDDRPLYVVDGVIYKGNIKRINAESILQVVVLKPPGSTNIYGQRGKNGVILLETLKFGKEYCQKKLSQFSIQYQDYLKLNRNDDSELVYVVDGTASYGWQPETFRQLYGEIEQVKTVDFIPKFSEDLWNKTPIVVITTKK